MHEAVRCEAVVYAYGAHNALSADMPISLSIKLRLVEDIAQCLRDAGKNVIVEHY